MWCDLSCVSVCNILAVEPLVMYVCRVIVQRSADEINVIVDLASLDCQCSGSSPRFFFFQAEDGIRDHCVTGVQTCALPICRVAPVVSAPRDRRFRQAAGSATIRSRRKTLLRMALMNDRRKVGSDQYQNGSDRKSVV